MEPDTLEAGSVDEKFIETGSSLQGSPASTRKATSFVVGQLWPWKWPIPVALMPLIRLNHAHPASQTERSESSCFLLTWVVQFSTEQLMEWLRFQSEYSGQLLSM
jgi:hypothetical protein